METANDVPPVDTEPTAQELQEKYLRALADLDNLRKRKAVEIKAAHDLGEIHVLEMFLDVIDDFERALQAMQVAPDSANQEVLKGLQLTLDKFGRVLEQLGVQGFEAEGQRFQAELMEAIAETPSRTLPPGTVAGQVRKGYLRQGRLLRAAQVAVAVKPEEPDGDAE